MNISVQNQDKCRIIVDAMGGDFAPQNAVEGAILALDENKNIDLYLVGQKEKIIQVLNEKKLQFDESKIIHTCCMILSTHYLRSHISWCTTCICTIFLFLNS